MSGHPTSLRVPDDLMDDLKKIAEREHRPLAQLMIHMLRVQAAKEKKKS